jgi:hypothetical protein
MIEFRPPKIEPSFFERRKGLSKRGSEPPHDLEILRRSNVRKAFLVLFPKDDVVAQEKRKAGKPVFCIHRL